MKYAALFIFAAILLVGGALWSKQASSNDPDVISTSGIHWHPRLEIYIDGEQQEIPGNIGIGEMYASMPTYDLRMRMTAIHTHEPDGTIHFEFGGTVRKEDTTLGKFFRIWGKDFMEFGPSVTMAVNGEENAELADYTMKDGDMLVLRYE